MIETLPNRPLYLHEITSLKQSKKINNAEALFYEEDNINGVICFLLNINEKGYIIGFDKENNSWINVSKIINSQEYDEKSSDVISWVNNQHDNYGIYGMNE